MKYLYTISILLYLAAGTLYADEPALGRDEWLSIPSSGFMVHYQSGQAALADYTRRIADDILRQYLGPLEMEWDQPGHIFLFPDRASLISNNFYMQT